MKRKTSFVLRLCILYRLICFSLTKKEHNKLKLLSNKCHCCALLWFSDWITYESALSLDLITGFGWCLFWQLFIQSYRLLTLHYAF